MSNIDHPFFDRLFGAGNHDVAVDGPFLSGSARVDGRTVAVIGTREHAAIDTDLALRIAAAVLAVVQADAGQATRPIVFIADTRGQALSRHDELLCLNGYFAHVARCVDLARRNGHRLVTLIEGEAVSGGFLAFGMLADTICALPGAEVRVMDLRAMSRVTKIPLERLEQLAQQSPVFAPGAENYWRMGGVHEIWPDTPDWPDRLAAAIAGDVTADMRAQLGFERSGRLLAAKISERVATA